MSYDLDVRADQGYSRAVRMPHVASIISSLPGVTRTGPTSFVLDRLPAGIHVNLDLVHQSAQDEDATPESDEINSVGLSVPYPLLEASGPVALEMAFRIAEALGWSVYDPQGDCEVSRESSGQALELQESSGAAARTVLERAAAAEASLGELFSQEMWNHGLIAGVMSFLGVAAASIWLMLTLEWPKERFDKYLPWSLTLGGLGVHLRPMLRPDGRAPQLFAEGKFRRAPGGPPSADMCNMDQPLEGPLRRRCARQRTTNGIVVVCDPQLSNQSIPSLTRSNLRA